jgi:sensor histidine kinase YesM
MRCDNSVYLNINIRPESTTFITKYGASIDMANESPQDDWQGKPELGWYAVVLALIAIGVVLLVALLTARSPRLVFVLVLPVTLLSVLGATICGALVWRANTLRLRLETETLAVALLVATTLGGMGGGVLGLALRRAMRESGVDEFATGAAFNRVMVGGAAMGLLIGFALLVLARIREREMAVIAKQSQLETMRERTEKEHAVADLKVLQAQIEPHFLYNTLANLRQLIRTDSDAALNLLEHLIRYFKFSIPNLREKSVPLSQELVLCEAYVEIMRIRTAQPINLNIEVPLIAQNSSVPPGMLLTLVENVVKHGLPAQGAAHIRIRADLREDHLTIGVADNGPGLANATSTVTGTGVGLANIRSRLQLLFGTEASLQLSPSTIGGCDVTLLLPHKAYDH